MVRDSDQHLAYPFETRDQTTKIKIQLTTIFSFIIIADLWFHHKKLYWVKVRMSVQVSIIVHLLILSKQSLLDVRDMA